MLSCEPQPFQSIDRVEQAVDVRIPQLSRRDKSVRTIKEAQHFKYTDKDDGNLILKATSSHIKLFKISRGSDYTISA